MSSRPSPIPIPISSLLPPSSSSSSSFAGSTSDSRPGISTSYFGPTSFILGPLPSTSPIHLALNYLSIADNQAYDKPVLDLPANDQFYNLHTAKGKGKGKEQPLDQDVTHPATKAEDGSPRLREIRAKERVLIITGQKGNYIDLLKDEDEDYFRSSSGHWGFLKRLKRIDMRYCPTPAHLKILLTLLTESESRLTSTPTPSNRSNQPQNLESTPSLIIFWDIAGMFMLDEDKNIDENEPPPPPFGSGRDEGMPQGEDELGGDQDINKEEGSGKKFKSGVCISDYMDFLAAAKATIEHFNSLHPSDPPTQLIILETSLNPLTTLPILPPLSSENEDPKMPKSARERKISIIDGARWLLGKDSIGVIYRLSGEANSSTSFFSLTFEKDQEKSYQMKKRRCPKAEYSVPHFEGQDDMPMSWRWEWVSS